MALTVEGRRSYEGSTFVLDTGEAVDGIGPGGALPGCVEGYGDFPFDFYDGVLTGSLDQDINVFSRANFLDPWAGLATGALRQWVGNTVASELAFRWTSFGPVVPDTDGDGIKDPVDGQWQGGVFIDESTSFSNYFSDQGVVGAPGTTFGEILTRGGLTIQVVDDKSAGLNLTASGASGTADVRVCGFATLQLSSGDSLAIECGSITTTVLAGTANMQFGSQTTLTAPEGASFRVEELSPDAFRVTNTSEEGSDIEIFVNDGSGGIGVLPNITVETGVRGVDVMVMQGRASQKCVNLNQRGLLQAAVLGETDLDPTSVDVSALTLSGLLPGVTGSGESACRVMDVNDDGLWYLICKFEKNAATWDGDETRMTLKGKLIDNTRIEGVDPVCVIAKGLLR